ncbi:MAG: indole-3-glycerol-phosphate synthase [Halobacteriaceae archaeon]
MGALTAGIERVTSTEPVYLLGEVKVRTPRDGDLLDDRDPAAVARALTDAGAHGVSVVTESEHFGGSLDLLTAVREAVGEPVLAKDFVASRADVDQLAERGADAVLLISGDLDDARLADLVAYCRDRGVDPLVETHTRDQVETANRLGCRLVGINNRDIQRLERDDGGVERTETLAPAVRSDALVVSESALTSGAAVRRATDADADAVLVGTRLLTAPAVGDAVEELLP